MAMNNMKEKKERNIEQAALQQIIVVLPFWYLFCVFLARERLYASYKMFVCMFV